MRVLYESLFFDATDPDGVRGPGHVIYRALCRTGIDLELLGPPTRPPWLLERLLHRVYRRLTGRRYLRFPLSQASRAGAALTAAAASSRPDVVVTMFPAALWRYGASAPVVYRVDTTYAALSREYPEYGYSVLMAGLASRFQARACQRSTLLVTHSDWSRGCLEHEYGVPREKLRIFPNTGGLPPEALGGTEGLVRELSPPLRLLLIGLDARRKGLDVAVEAVRILNESGIEARLTVCGLRGEDTALVRFVGPFDKGRPEELKAYTDLYRESHLLLHPARFDPSPMVVAEAAAFALPTVTHAVGGLPASVEDGGSGVVLAARSPAAAYAQAVAALLAEPERYRRLCRRAFERYGQEQSWDRFGENLLGVLEEAVALGAPQ